MTTTTTTTTTEIGRFGEDAAVKYLKRRLYRILERNYRAGHNEIDIIAKRGRYIVFVEVKTRTDGLPDWNYGKPADAVDRGKRIRTITAAKTYLYKSGSEKLPRYDIIEVYLARTPRYSSARSIRKITHIKNAFQSWGGL